MSKKSLFPLFAIVFATACGTNVNNRDKQNMESALASQYEEDDASAEVDEQKFGAYLIDSYNESALNLAEEANVESEKKPEKISPEKMAERMQKMKGEKEAREGKQKEHVKEEKEKPAEKVKPAFRLALEGSRQYVMALIGLDNSPFEKFRAALVEAKATAKSEEEFKTLVAELKKTFKEEKAAAWAKAEAGRTEHKTEIEAIRASRKEVLSACTVDNGKKSGIKDDEKIKPEEASKTAPTAEEIAARKASRETERYEMKEKHEDRKLKAESAECTTATSALKALTAQQ